MLRDALKLWFWLWFGFCRSTQSGLQTGLGLLGILPIRILFDDQAAIPFTGRDHVGVHQLGESALNCILAMALEKGGDE